MIVRIKTGIAALLSVFITVGGLMFGAQMPVYLGTAEKFVILTKAGTGEKK